MEHTQELINKVDLMKYVVAQVVHNGWLIAIVVTAVVLVLRGFAEEKSTYQGDYRREE